MAKFKFADGKFEFCHRHFFARAHRDLSAKRYEQYYTDLLHRPYVSANGTAEDMISSPPTAEQFVRYKRQSWYLPSKRPHLTGEPLNAVKKSYKKRIKRLKNSRFCPFGS